MVMTKKFINDFYKTINYASYTNIKALSREELMNCIERIKKTNNCMDWKFKTKPRINQLVGFLIGMNEKQWLYFFAQGTGKTKIVLDVLTYRKHVNRDKKFKRMLIIAPNDAGIATWEEEINKHTDLTYCSLLGTRKKKNKLLKSHNTADIFITTYSGLQVIFSSLLPVNPNDPNSRRKRQIDEKEIKRILSDFEAVVFDEIQHAKNRKSLTYKISAKVSNKLNLSYGLTGTPFGRNVQDLWSQFYIIDRGATLGKYITMFRKYYFDEKIDWWGAYTYTFKEKLKEHLHYRIQNRSTHYSTDEVLDLPPKVYNVIKYELPHKTMKYYKMVENKFLKVENNFTELKHTYITMRQITSGYMRIKDEDGKIFEFTFDDNLKLKALMDIVLNLDNNSQMVIFYKFSKSCELIVNEMKKNNVTYLILNGGNKDKITTVQNFRHNNCIKILIVQIQCGAESMNLQNANYLAFYEDVEDSIQREQAEARIHRSGQTNTTFYYDFVALKTIDEKVKKYREIGENYLSAILKNRKV